METGFVIEREAKVKEYFCIVGGGAEAAFAWTPNAIAALRFARMTDAAAMRGTVADECHVVGVNSPMAALVQAAVNAATGKQQCQDV